jgi:hypothetical protein
LNPFTLEPYLEDDEDDGNYSEANFQKNANFSSMEIATIKKKHRNSDNISLYEPEQLEKNEYDSRLPRFKTIALKPKGSKKTII